MSKNSQIVICGAGPVGLIAALKFAQAGLDVTIIDADDHVNDSPRACVYFSATLEGLDTLGLLQDVEKRSYVKGNTGWYCPDYNWFRSMPAPDPSAGPYLYMANVGQEEIGELIVQRLAAFPNVQLLWNTRLEAFQDHGDRVTVQVEAEGRRETISCDWLIGADGARSTVRQLMGVDFVGHTWPSRFFAANVNFNFIDAGMTDGNFRLDPDSWAIVVRVNNRGVWRIAYGEDGSLPDEGAEERAKAKLNDFIPEGEPFDLLRLTPYRAHQRAAETLRKGRVVLAGDSAHATNPFGGLGLTTGIWDALILGDLLPAVIAGEAAENALDAYSKERLRVYWELTSPIASRNLLMAQERDPAKRRAYMASIDEMLASEQARLDFVRFSYRLIGDPIIEKSHWRQYHAA